MPETVASPHLSPGRIPDRADMTTGTPTEASIATGKTLETAALPHLRPRRIPHRAHMMTGTPTETSIATGKTLETTASPHLHPRRIPPRAHMMTGTPTETSIATGKTLETTASPHLHPRRIPPRANMMTGTLTEASVTTGKTPETTASPQDPLHGRLEDRHRTKAQQRHREYHRDSSVSPVQHWQNLSRRKRILEIEASHHLHHGMILADVYSVDPRNRSCSPLFNWDYPSRHSTSPQPSTSHKTNRGSRCIEPLTDNYQLPLIRARKTRHMHTQSFVLLAPHCYHTPPRTHT